MIQDSEVLRPPALSIRHDVSWFQSRPSISLKLIEATGVGKDNSIIDVGGGASVLVDFLLDAGFVKPAVLDISAAGLAHAKARLDQRAAGVDWFDADVTEFNPLRRFHVWHDRAVFHFLTNEEDRRKYVQTLKRALVPDGHAIIASFAINVRKAITPRTILVSVAREQRSRHHSTALRDRPHHPRT